MSALHHQTSPPGDAPPALRAVDAGAFCLLIAVILWKAISDADLNWDSLNYHLPFAARRIGLIPHSVYQFQDWLEDCYRGIPAPPYYLYGFLWRITGNINAPNLVSGIAFAGYCLFVARAFRAPLIVPALAIAAIPVIQVNLPSIYTDLVTNLSFAGALVLVTSILIEPARPILGRVLGALLCAGVAANVKVQFIALAGAFVPAFAVLLFVAKHDGRRLLAILGQEVSQRSIWMKAAVLGAVVLCYASALKNTIFEYNPFFPVGIDVLGHHVLKGVTNASDHYHEPQYLNGTPQPVRWLLSVLEYLSLGSRPVPYTVGQGNVAPDSQGLRMGGYCAVFVIYNLGLFTWTTLFSERPRRALFAGFIVLTAAVSVLPSSHELRYYAFWLVYLVTMNIALLWVWQPSREARRHFALVAAGTFVFVASVTGWHAFIPQHVTMTNFITSLNLSRVYEPKLEDGQKYCLVNWGPAPMFGSSYFHPGHTYSAREAWGPECAPDSIKMDLAALRAAAPAP